MDINTGTLEYALLGSPKQEKRIKLGLCFKYGSKNHILKYYLVPLPTS